jgi:signal transduction histidine kinase
MAQAPAEAVDHEIEKWLGRICLDLDLDRSGIYEQDAPEKEVRATHTWVRAGFPPFPRKLDPEKLVKNTTHWILAGNWLVFSRPSQIPAELEDMRRFVEKWGPRASAIIPMWAGNRVIGGASFGRFRSTREWRPELLKQLALAVRIFGSAIERKQAEAAAQRARAQLRIAQRRSMISELIGSLSHEINQPLGAILSNLEGVERLLSRGNLRDSAAASAVHNAIEDTKRASDIIRRVRKMLKGGQTQRVAIDIDLLVREVVQLLAGEAALRGIAVEISVARALARVVGDRLLLQQCVVNLLMNAFESITSSKSGQGSVTVEITQEKPGWIAISIHDSGAGIHQSVADRLFEPFVTTKSEGMGLGLLVTRSAVEEHGGRIWSRPNTTGGATFTFTLPAAKRKSRVARHFEILDSENPVRSDCVSD